MLKRWKKSSQTITKKPGSISKKDWDEATPGEREIYRQLYPDPLRDPKAQEQTITEDVPEGVDIEYGIQDGDFSTEVLDEDDEGATHREEEENDEQLPETDEERQEYEERMNDAPARNHVDPDGETIFERPSPFDDLNLV